MKKVRITPTKVFRFLSICCLVLLALSHAGSLHASGDTFALIAPLLAMFGLIFSFAFRKLIKWAFIGVFSIWLSLHTYSLLRISGTDGELVLYQKNNWFANSEHVGLANDIRASGAHFVTLQELPQDSKLLIELESDFPHQHVCQFSGWSGMAVLSKYELITRTKLCSDWRGLAAVQVEVQGKPLWLVSLHLPWPYPHEQSERFKEIEPLLGKMQGDVIVGGDLNMFPSTRITRRIAKLTRNHELRPIHATLEIKGIPVAIDHIFARSGKVERRGKIGSDHYGLVARITQ